jgi:NAD-dependent DNA ligase
MIAIQAPTHCPSCNAVLESVNYLLYCRNASCGAKIGKLIEHFASCLKIKGLGPATIRKLDIQDLSELYSFEVLERLSTALNSARLASKLKEELDRSQDAPLNVLLPAFSIPLIGKTAAQKLSNVCNSITDIDYDRCCAAGLGEKSTASLLSWLELEYPQVQNLPFSWKFVKAQNTSIVKGVVCITGKLVSYKTKALAQEALQQSGYEVKSSLTRDVTILVNESGIESAKTKQARAAGVTIVTNLLILTGE